MGPNLSRPNVGAYVNWKENADAILYINKFSAWYSTLSSSADSIRAWSKFSLDITHVNEDLQPLDEYLKSFLNEIDKIKDYFKEDAEKMFSKEIASVINQQACLQLDYTLNNLRDLINHFMVKYNQCIKSRTTKDINELLKLYSSFEDEIAKMLEAFSRKDEIGNEIFRDIKFERKTNAVTPIEKPLVKLPQSVISMRESCGKALGNMKKANPNETVMEYAALAKNNNILEQIFIMLNNLNIPSNVQESLQDTVAVFNWIKGIAPNYGISFEDSGNIHQALNKSADRHKSDGAWESEDNKAYGDSQYTYMLKTSSIIYSLYGKHKAKKADSLQSLISSYLNILVDQNGRCKSGMLGRMFAINMQILNFLIEEYRAP